MRIPVLLLVASVTLPLALASCQKVSVPRVSSKYGDMNEFARQFTQHYLDSNYQTYASSQAALKNEASPGLYEALKKNGLVPKNDKEMKNKLAQLTKKKQTSEVVVDDVKAGDVNAQSLAQVEVKGKVTGAGARPFDLTYGIGIRKDSNRLAVVTISGK